MTLDQRKQLVQAVSSGLDIAAACAQLGISLKEVKKSGKLLSKQLDEAYLTGTARLRGRLLKSALTDDNSKVIQDILEQRDLIVAAQPVEKIIRVIINPPCPQCGHIQPPPTPGLNKPKSNGAGE